jgi:CHAT domain-containing protein/Flp pilus assembly protein TadD
MLRKLLTTLILLASPLWSFGQSSDRNVQTENELAATLCAQGGESAREQLLASNPRLVNKDLWEALNSRAATAYYVSSPEQSLASYNVALEVAAHLKSPRLLATTYYNIGRTYSGLNQIPKAIDAYERSRSVFAESKLQNDLTYILADLGLLYFIQEDYPRAARYSEQALSLSQTTASPTDSPGIWPMEYGRATALSTLANLDLREGNFGEAVEKFKRAQTLHQQLNRDGSSFSSYIAGDLQAIGHAYTSSGDYAQALRYLTDALKLVENLSDANSMASLQNDIGVLYLEQEDYPQAKKGFDESLRIHLANNNQREAASVLLNLGVTEQRQSNYDEALARFKSSLEFAKRVHSIDAMIAAGEGVGVVLTAKHEFPGALEALDQSFRLAKDLQETTRQTELTWRISQTYYEMGDFQQATARAEEAVALSHVSHSPKLTYLATTTLGEVYAAQNKIELATQTLKQAVDELELMREQVAGSEVESELFLENKIASYRSLVDLFVKQNKPLDALLFAERAKGRVLLDVLSSERTELTRLMTPAERDEAHRLNQRISEINDQIRLRESSNSSPDTLYRQLDSARLEYQAFRNALYAAHPDLRIRSGRPSLLTSNDLNRLTLNNRRAFLEYVTLKDQIYLFVLSPGNATQSPKLYVHSIAIKPQDLERKVEEFHQRLADRHPDFAGLARELYSTLITPAESELRGIDAICVIPDSFLWNLPFQALMTGGGRYLIEDRALSYAHSLSVLNEMTKDKEDSTTKNSSLIAFGNPVIGKDEERKTELCPLPEAETEVTSIAKSFSSTSNKILIGREASEKTFKSLASQYSVIHLATHGVLDNRQPLYSRLLLTKTEADVENDGLLEAREIMNMKLKADLAVLSACDTANGKISPGEGVMGMSWAFFLAGTRSMLVSQWKVNSSSTSQLMMNFYKALETPKAQSSDKKADALRQAALVLMKNQQYRHPFYWAGFVMIGDDR